MNNKLGWVTSLSYTFEDGLTDVTSFSDAKPTFIRSPGIIRGSMDFIAQDVGALREFMQDLRSGRAAPAYQKEFMCLYCGSPNSIEKTHCKSCGAPRSFIIG